MLPWVRRRGFTLLEVLVTSVILLVALIPVVTSFHSGYSQLRRQLDHHQAVALAEGVMAFCRARTTDPSATGFKLAGRSFPDGQSFTDPHQSADDAVRALGFPVAPAGYSYSVKFEKPADSGGDVLLEAPRNEALAAALRRSMTRITVSVRWGGLLSNSLSIRTLQASARGY